MMPAPFYYRFVADRKSGVTKKKKDIGARKGKPSPGAAHARASGASPEAARRAAELAQRMPLVHFPANLPFDQWATGPDRWQALLSKKARGDTSFPDTDFGRLHGQHVFAIRWPILLLP